MLPIFLHIGPLRLHTYGLMVALGFWVGYQIALRSFRKQNWSDGLLDELILWLMISGILGARIFYFIFEAFDILKSDPLSFFRIWEGGLVFFGGFILGVGALVVFSRRKNISFLLLSDALIPSLLIGHALGRIGCFAAGCCYGKPTASILGVTFTSPDSLAPTFIALHPTQLYSAAGDFILFLWSLSIQRRSHFAGALTAFYLMAYGVFRFFIEFVRNDDRGIILQGFTPSQIISILTILIGILLVIYAKKTERKA